MQESPRFPLHESHPTVTGWLLSCLLHVSLILATTLFVQGMHLTPQGEQFHWNVAMVATPMPSVTDPTPGNVTPPPAKRIPSAGRPVQPTQSTSVASSPPAPRPDIAPPPQQVAPLPNDVHPMSVVPTPSLPQLIPLTEHPASPQPDSGQTSATPVDMAPSSPPLDAPVTPVASAGSRQSALGDSGWLATLMAQWIEELDKRYPVALRTDGVAGKVTLIALLHEDGSLSNVRIAQGSGNATLDQVALEDVRNGPPVKLPRPLARPQITVKFSISYDLRTAR